MMNHVSNDMINRMTRIDRATMSPFAISAPRPYGFSTAVSCIDRFPLLNSAYCLIVLTSHVLNNIHYDSLLNFSFPGRGRLLVREFPDNGYGHRLLDRFTVFHRRYDALSVHALETRLIQPRKPAARLNLLRRDLTAGRDGHFHHAPAFFVRAPGAVGIELFADLQGMLGIHPDVGEAMLHRRRCCDRRRCALLRRLRDRRGLLLRRLNVHEFRRRHEGLDFLELRRRRRRLVDVLGLVDLRDFYRRYDFLIELAGQAGVEGPHDHDM